MVVNDLIKLYFTAQNGILSDGTLKWYAHYLQPLRERFGTIEIDSIRTSDLRRLFQEIRLQGYSPFTVFNFVRAWKRLFRWGEQEELITKNPATALKLPPLPKKSPAGISEKDFRKLLEQAELTTTPERDVAILWFLYDTGARVGGVAALTIDELDIENRRAIVTEKGRGGKRERTVYFLPRTAKAMQAWLNARPEKNDKRVFQISEYGIYLMLKRLAKRADIKGRWNPHAFRHAYARRLLARGASLGVVSHLMGHANVQVTIQYYGRFSNDELQEIYTQLMLKGEGEE